jgi:hypothetical protein
MWNLLPSREYFSGGNTYSNAALLFTIFLAGAVCLEDQGSVHAARAAGAVEPKGAAERRGQRIREERAEIRVELPVANAPCDVRDAIVARRQTRGARGAVIELPGISCLDHIASVIWRNAENVVVVRRRGSRSSLKVSRRTSVGRVIQQAAVFCRHAEGEGGES